MATQDNPAITLIKEWKSEARNPRNDGWVQKHYKDKLKEVSKYLDETLKEINPEDYEEADLYKNYGGD